MAVATFNHSEARIKFYTDLCLQRHITPKNHLLMSPKELGDNITTMLKFQPATDAQLNGIRKRILQLQEIGVHINTISDEELYTYSGGKEGTASKKIEFLNSLIKDYSDKAPLSEQQFNTLSEMYLCIDIDFESMGLSRKVDLENGLWRRCTREEFDEQIKEKFNHKNASMFIDKYKVTFYKWKKERITKEQKEFIRKLEGRLIETKKPKVIEYALDLSGNIIELPQTAKSHEEDTSNPQGYNSIDEDLLDLFSQKTANQHINDLQLRIKIKEKNEIPQDETLEELRKPKTAEDIKKTEYAELSDIMFKLEAVVGYADEDLHQSIVSLLTEDVETDDYTRPRKDKIRNFMLDALNNDAIDFGGLVTLCNENPIALNILLYQY